MLNTSALIHVHVAAMYKLKPLTKTLNFCSEHLAMFSPSKLIASKLDFSPELGLKQGGRGAQTIINLM